VGIYAALSGDSKAKVLADFGGGQFSGFKSALVDLSVEKLAPITAEMSRLIADPGHIDAILADGAQRARAIAAPVMRDVKEIMGFVSGG
jgi:tryptophanyl-tRNA synthetase